MVKRKLDLKLLCTPTCLTGVENRAQVINSWLKDEQSSTNFLAICCMGGGGKTTLAQYVYNSNKLNFESSSFVEEIGTRSNEHHGLIGLQKQLLKDVLGGKSVMISTVCEGTRKIEEALEMKKVLIVLDDIDKYDQLDALLGGKVVHTQSRIIITTRFLDINARFGPDSRRCWVHKLELLNYFESLELFSWHAFGSKLPMPGFEKLVIQLAEYCSGNPLALKVLGSSLFIGDEDPIKTNSFLQIWQSRLESLNSLKGDVHSHIQVILRRSFDSLPYNEDKELFLHIACFFVENPQKKVVSIFEDDLHAESGIMTLVNRCLLIVSPSGIVKMHQLLRDMGRNIVRDGSKNLAERSRVWCSDEAYRLLSKGDSCEKIEGLSLDSRKLSMDGTKPTLKTESFVKMKKLKLLELKYVELVGPYTKFPELRWLCWHRCHLIIIPFGLMSNNLVALDLAHGKLQKFEPPTKLGSLKTLDLRYSYQLVSIYNFSRLPSLETLLLKGCSSLAHVCKTIEHLNRLNRLELTGCTKLLMGSLNNQLERLKASFVSKGIQEQQLLTLPKSLEFLHLDQCYIHLNNYVNVVFHAQSFFVMSLRDNLFKSLPDKINLKRVRKLHLGCCLNLKSLAYLPSTLEDLDISWCTSLERITFQSTRYSLQTIIHEGCSKLSEIQGLFKLVSIAKIDAADLRDMRWIKAYKHQNVELVGDVITEGRSWHVQMLYEYGIRSTYLQGIKDKSMMAFEHTSSSNFLSFCVSLHPKKHRIQGLKVCFLYRSLCEDKNIWVLFAKISNRTKGLTWAYNPVVYCKPKVDKDVVWLSFWPIGNTNLDEGDEVVVEIYGEEGLIVSVSHASLEYNDEEVREEENCENSTRQEEVIGGDLSEFEVIPGGYYLCRRNLSNTLDWLKRLFGDNIHYTDSRGWRKSIHSIPAIMDPILHESSLCKEIKLVVKVKNKSEMEKIEKEISSIAGVESVRALNELGELYVEGLVRLEEQATYMEKIKKMVRMTDDDCIVSRGTKWEFLVWRMMDEAHIRYRQIKWELLGHVRSLLHLVWMLYLASPNIGNWDVPVLLIVLLRANRIYKCAQFVSAHKELRRLNVTENFDPEEMATTVEKNEKMVRMNILLILLYVTLSIFLIFYGNWKNIRPSFVLVTLTICNGIDMISRNDLIEVQESTFPYKYLTRELNIAKSWINSPRGLGDLHELVLSLFYLSGFIVAVSTTYFKLATHSGN